MLIKCPECDLQVSDKAFACPHCGYPFKKDSRPYKSSKRKRLPNGFGQISEIKGKNLRNPFRVMVTVRKDEHGRPVQKLLKPKAYFETYNEAYSALIEYNRNPYDLDDDMTVKELYEKWSSQYFETLKNDSSKRTITAAWAYCSSVYTMRVKDIRARHIKGCIEEGYITVKGKTKTPSANIKDRIKSMFNLMLDYALEYELVDKNYARTFNLGKDITNEIEQMRRAHIPFTDKELGILWNNVDIIKWVDIVLIQCYSGWRPQELGLIELKNVNLDKNIIIGGMKTDAGTNRLVPIHPKIKDLIAARYKEAINLGSDYLINCTDGATHSSSIKFTYDKYTQRFKKILSRLELNPGHRPHDGRNTFITLAKKYKVDEYAIKYIVGHAINDITEKVYTERDEKWLIEEMKKIK